MPATSSSLDEILLHVIRTYLPRLVRGRSCAPRGAEADDIAQDAACYLIEVAHRPNFLASTHTSVERRLRAIARDRVRSLSDERVRHKDALIRATLSLAPAPDANDDAPDEVVCPETAEQHNFDAFDADRHRPDAELLRPSMDRSDFVNTRLALLTPAQQVYFRAALSPETLTPELLTAANCPGLLPVATILARRHDTTPIDSHDHDEMNARVGALLFGNGDRDVRDKVGRSIRNAAKRLMAA